MTHNRLHVEKSPCIGLSCIGLLLSDKAHLHPLLVKLFSVSDGRERRSTVSSTGNFLGNQQLR